MRRIVWRAPLVTEFSTVVRYRPRRIMAYANWVDKKKPVSAAHESRGRDEKSIYRLFEIPFTLTHRTVLSSFIFFPLSFSSFLCFALSTVPFLAFFSLNHLRNAYHCDALFPNNSRMSLILFSRKKNCLRNYSYSINTTMPTWGCNYEWRLTSWL